MRARVRAVLAFSAVVLRSFVRDREALFFMLLMPVAVIVIIGATFGGQGRIRVGVVVSGDSAAGDLVMSELRAADGIDVETYDDSGGLARDIRRYIVDAGVVVPAGVDSAVAAGQQAEIGFMTGAPSEDVLTVRLAVESIVDEAAVQLGAAAFATEHVEVSFGEALDAAAEAGASGGVTVVTSDVGSGGVSAESDFSYVAPQNLVLFTFVNAMASAAFFVRMRKDGVLRRAMATPTSLGSLLLGLAIGWYALALVQATLILVIGRVLFDVHWGDPVAAGLLVAFWALVGCGAGLLVGALGENEDRVGAVMPIVGLVLGALGGCMVPLEVFPPSMRTIANGVPHTWALDGFQTTIFDGGGPGDIVRPLAVLAAWAVSLLVVATTLLRRRLIRG